MLTKEKYIERKLKPANYRIEVTVQTGLNKVYDVRFYALSKQAAQEIMKKAVDCDAVVQAVVKRNHFVDGQLKTDMKMWSRSLEAGRRHEELLLLDKPYELPEIFKQGKKWVAEYCPISTQVYIQEKINARQEAAIAGDLEQAHSGAVIVKYNREWWLDKSGQLRWKVLK